MLRAFSHERWLRTPRVFVWLWSSTILAVTFSFLTPRTGLIAIAQEPVGDPPVVVLKEGFLNDCRYVSAEENGAKLSDVWSLIEVADASDPTLVCKGKPHGYLVFDKLGKLRDYEMSFEFKYPADPNGNSGILVHTSGADKIWPDAIQVQLLRPTAGSIFASGDAKTDNRVEVKDLARDVNAWNTCVVTCTDGRISVTINDQKAGEVTGCQPSEGKLALQSEGAEVHFRRITIRRMTSSPIENLDTTAAR